MHLVASKDSFIPVRLAIDPESVEVLRLTEPCLASSDLSLTSELSGPNRKLVAVNRKTPRIPN
jgi:hypothetical protein